MRDPERIPAILLALAVVWDAHPDWRLGQLLHNILGDKLTHNRYSGAWYDDLFYIEDETLLEALKGAEARDGR